MTIKRRDFLKTVGTSAVVAGFAVPGTPLVPPAEELSQKLHADFCSDIPGAEYYLLGNGLIQAVLQTVPEGNPETHCGLLIMSPEHFGRKVSTFLYHPERGLERTRFNVGVDGTGYVPQYKTTTTSWKYPDEVPTLVVEWEAGTCRVREEYTVPIGAAVLIRMVTVSNAGTAPAKVTGTIMLSPNFMFFDEYSVDRVKMTLTARGYHQMQLFPTGPATIGDRHLGVDFGTLQPEEERSTGFILTLDHPREEVERRGIEPLRAASSEYWGKRASLNLRDQGLNHLFRASVTGIRAAVAASGKVDGSIWQYNQEWVRDHCWVAIGATMLGHTDVARAMFERIVSHEIDDEGKTLESSRLRPPETFELDQNGIVLYALRQYWAWTGDDSLLRRHWKKLEAVAEYILQPMFYDPKVGLLKNSREFWERDPFFGVRDGYELAYQLFTILGMEAAAEMATHMGLPERASRWNAVARNVRQAFVSHPRFSLVDGDHLTKRRMATGEVQKTLEPPNRKSLTPGTPLREESVSYCDADSSVTFPIIFEAVDPTSPLALNTLKFLERLWNQRWKDGGYGRYDASSEPDSPGPWPVAALFFARAYLEAGDHAKVWRALDWIQKVQGGKSGSWLEFYGNRPVPPLPPIGILPWTWGEITMFFVHHLLGVRPSPDSLTVRPKLLTGMDLMEARLPMRGTALRLVVRKTEGAPAASVDGKPVQVRNGKVTIPLPTRETLVEMELPVAVSKQEGTR